MFYQSLSFKECDIEAVSVPRVGLISSRSQIRNSMAPLPEWIQPFLTWLTAVPLTSQKPSQHGSVYHLGTSLLTLGLGVLFSAIGLYSTPDFFTKTMFLILGMSCSLSAMRKLQVVIVHHCSHFNFFDRKSIWNGRLGSALSFLLFTEPFKAYQSAHIHDHHFTEHMTLLDPTVKFLFDRVGLKPGMSVDQSIRKIIFCFLSPKFYAGTWKQRFIEQKQASTTYQAFLVIYASTLLLTSIIFGFVPLLLASFLIPLFVMYPVSSTLRLVVEHTFPEDQNDRKFDLGSHSFLTNAVFCGEEYPNEPFAKTKWLVRMLLIHVPTRFLILIGDTPVHDHHHRNPIYKNWPNYAYASKTEMYIQKPGYSAYREIWGFPQAFKHSLLSLENQRTSR